MSSFQIDLAPGLVPDVALLSNLSPDHIDRHGSMQNYAAVKARLLRQTAKDGQVASAWTMNIPPPSSPRLPPRAGPGLSGFGRQSAGPRHIRGGWRALRCPGRPRRQGDGHGDGHRIFPARTTGRMRRWPMPRSGLLSTTPRPSPPPSRASRASPIAWKMSAISARRVFINNSKATNADATARALAVYPDIFWIAGRQAQGRRHHFAGVLFSPHPQGLSDRRGGAASSRARWTARRCMKCPARWMWR